MGNLVNLARQYATIQHEGVLRKDNITPYIVHPVTVAKYVQEYGAMHPELNVTDETIAAALLHDTIEDTDSTYEDIKKIFGKSVADKVQLLTKYGSREEYKLGIKEKASPDVQLVKICDVIHNVETMKYLNEDGQYRKINDSIGMYIPMAKKICPEAGKKLFELIKPHISRHH